jgi:hypothetical protein
MASMPSQLDPVSCVVVGGVDTHKDLHVAAVVNTDAVALGTESFSTTRAGLVSSSATSSAHLGAPPSWKLSTARNACRAGAGCRRDKPCRVRSRPSVHLSGSRSPHTKTERVSQPGSGPALEAQLSVGP